MKLKEHAERLHKHREEARKAAAGILMIGPRPAPSTIDLLLEAVIDLLFVTEPLEKGEKHGESDPKDTSGCCDRCAAYEPVIRAAEAAAAECRTGGPLYMLAVLRALQRVPNKWRFAEGLGDGEESEADAWEREGWQSCWRCGSKMRPIAGDAWETHLRCTYCKAEITRESRPGDTT